MMKKPETESMKLWTASEVIAMEPDKRPIAILKMPRRKLVPIKRYPAFSMAWLRVEESESEEFLVIMGIF